MSDIKSILYGAVRDKLVSNGYVPTSALRPGAHGWQAADDPAACVLAPQYLGRCGVPDAYKLTIATLHILARNVKVRSAIVDVLAKHGIKGGPVRTDSAGNEAYIVRWENSYSPPLSQEIESEGAPVFAVGGYEKTPAAMASADTSAIIKCDGSWRNGDLLTVGRSELPGIEDDDALRSIIADIRAVIRAHEPDAPVADYYRPGEPEDPNFPTYKRTEMEPAGKDRRGGTVGINGGSGLPHRQATQLERIGQDD